MMYGLIGKKMGMTQIFSENGKLIPVTLIEAGPCKVVQKKTREKDGYNALQLGFMEIKPKRANKPQQGHFKKANFQPMRYLKEFKIDSHDDISMGQDIKVDMFKPGDYVDVTARAKGKGFAGVMKRHGMSGAPATHGTHESRRHVGSIGSTTFPGRVFKGKKMPGRMGGQRVTVQNLLIINVIREKNLLVIKGCVPGHNGRTMIIKKSIKNLGNG